MALPQTFYGKPLSSRQGHGAQQSPSNEEEAVGDLFNHLDTHKSYGTKCDPPRVSTQMLEELTKPSFISSPA